MGHFSMSDRALHLNCTFAMQINDLLVNKLENRLVVLTHDLATMHYLQKMLEDLFYRGKQGYVLRELDQQKLQKFQWNSRQEYSALLLITYQYACADQPKNDVVVGNALRRIMEAFTMFSYGKTMRFLSKKINYWQKINRNTYHIFKI